MTKKWIYEGEFRSPEVGERYIQHETMDAPGSVRIRTKLCLPAGCDWRPMFIVHPIPDDVVMVPRERIESLKGGLASIVAGFGDRALSVAAHNLLACVEPEPKKDEILEAMRGAANLLYPDVPERVELEKAIDLREKELKEREQ